MRAALARALAAAALVSASAPSFPFAQSATCAAILEQYRRGEYEQAIAALNSLPQSEIDRASSASATSCIYAPANAAPGWRQIEVSLRSKRGKVTARRGYFVQ